MRVLVSFFTMPLSVFCFLLIAAGLLYYLKKRKSGLVLLFTSGFWLFFISTSVLSRYPVLFLERQYPPLITVPDSINGKNTYILILGSGHSCDTSLTAINQLSLNALGRLCEGIRLHQQIPESKIVLSGYGEVEPKSHAEMLKTVALEMGINDTCLLLQPNPWNTKDEAAEFKRLFNNECHLILITDAIHIPRSCYHFRKAGFYPVPAPVNHYIKISGYSPFYRSFRFSSNNILALEKATHEYIGLIWAYMGGD